MSANHDRQHCVICDRVIKPGLLMCAPHWRLVPGAEQAAVLRAYGKWVRDTGPAKDRMPLVLAYTKARDAAVAKVNEALAKTDLLESNDE